MAAKRRGANRAKPGRRRVAKPPKIKQQRLKSQKLVSQPKGAQRARSKSKAMAKANARALTKANPRSAVVTKQIPQRKAKPPTFTQGTISPYSGGPRIGIPVGEAESTVRLSEPTPLQRKQGNVMPPGVARMGGMKGGVRKRKLQGM